MNGDLIIYIVLYSLGSIVGLWHRKKKLQIEKSNIAVIVAAQNLIMLVGVIVGIFTFLFTNNLWYLTILRLVVYIVTVYGIMVGLKKYTEKYTTKKGTVQLLNIGDEVNTNFKYAVITNIMIIGAIIAQNVWIESTVLMYILFINLILLNQAYERYYLKTMDKKLKDKTKEELDEQKKRFDSAENIGDLYDETLYDRLKKQKDKYWKGGK